MVFAVTDRLSSCPLKVKRGGVEEDHVVAAEKIPAQMEQLLLDDIFGDPRREVRAIRLVFHLFPEIGHSPVQVVGRQAVYAMDDIIPAPPITEQVRTVRKMALSTSKANFRVARRRCSTMSTSRSFQSLSKMRAGPTFFASAWMSLLCPYRTISARSENRERERMRPSISPLPFSSSMRPTVAITRWTLFLSSLWFSTIWRYSYRPAFLILANMGLLY